MLRRYRALVVSSTIAANVATAQDFNSSATIREPNTRGQVISIQPLSAMLTVYSGELERALSRSVTLGIGATYFGPKFLDEELSYLSGDVKLRYYPSGRRLEGFSLGGSVGATRVAATDENSRDSGNATGMTVGTMLDYGWLLGDSKRFYVGLGAGAKALFIGEDKFSTDLTLRYPTFRVSVGWGF